jgi:methylenetetrahydrofolate reductase (NADPH)
VNDGNALAAAFADGRFVVTAEVVPPVSADPEALLERVRPLAGAKVAMASLAGAALLKQAGIEPVMQLACRDRNRIAIQGDLLGAAALGVRNVLLLHGDAPAVGDQAEAKPVFDYDSRDAIAALRTMRDQGVLPSGRALGTVPQLLIGTADTPVDPPAGWAPAKLADKAAAGADFVQTQFCFDAGLVRRYVAALGAAGLIDRMKLLLGVGPVTSARSARWMNANLFGVSVPEGWIERLERAAEPAEEGAALCADLVQALRDIPGLAGVHLMAPAGGAPAIARVLDRVGR